ncbi:MAG: glutamate--tRNA ligase [Bdellovibrionales bacterium]|nr:glutamate--tRNA ligase [Oligoflexia bacterium]
MNSSIRVRFAPSPTGFLHIGGVRTALFNYLFARRMGGKFLIRIEDTDTDRSEQRFTDDILTSLKWLSMEADEPMLYQSKRQAVYHALADDMIAKGLAYRCYCTEAEVETTREQMMKEGKKPMYARTCRNLEAPIPGRTSFAVRAKFPLSGTTTFTDLIRGDIHFPNEDLDDFVMVRTNGVPTYNFVVVVDDVEMKISHVIRGDDHINNTPKQIYLYEAMKAEKPLFAHLPMILGQDKKKLSKRNGETSTNAYRAEGYLPEALLNFLVRLGWSHGDQELFSRQEMIDLFDLSHVQVSAAIFNVEKLLWTAGEHLKHANPTRILDILKDDFKDKFSGKAASSLEGSLAMALIPLLQVKAKLIKELPDQMNSLLEPGVMAVDASSLKWNKDPAQKTKIKEAITALHCELEQKLAGTAILAESGVDHAQIDALLRTIAENFGLKLGDLTGPLRLFVTGNPAAAIGLFDLLPIMPWTTLSARLNASLQG